VVLSGLVWEAHQEAGQPAAASFSIGSASVAGQPVDLAGPGGTAAAFDAVNTALVPSGLHLDAPATTADATGGAVSPLVLQVRNPETTAAVLGAVTRPAAPALNQFMDALLAAAPDAAGARLVVNALLANGSGRSGGRLELGGASARIGSFEIASPEPPAPPEPMPAPSLPFPAAAIPAAAPPRRGAGAGRPSRLGPGPVAFPGPVPAVTVTPSLPRSSAPPGAGRSRGRTGVTGEGAWPRSPCARPPRLRGYARSSGARPGPGCDPDPGRW